MPMTTSPLDWASDRLGTARLTASTSPITMARILLMDVLLSSRTSVRERPDAKVVADVPPQPVQPFGLHDEEEDDEGAEHHEAEVGNEVEDGLRREEEAAERLHRVADPDGQERDEDGAEDRAQDGAQAPDDDHGEVVDGDADLELLVVGDAEVVRVEDAGDAGVEGGDGERQELVAENVDPDDLRCDVLVADGDERPPHAAPHQVESAHDGQHDEDEEEEVHLALAREHEGPQPRARHVDGGLDPAADEGDVVDGPLDDELTGERGDRQIEAFDADGGNAHHGADEGGHEAAGNEVDGPRRPQADGQVGR